MSYRERWQVIRFKNGQLQYTECLNCMHLQHYICHLLYKYADLDLMPLLGVFLSEFLDKPYFAKDRIMGLYDGEDLVILV